MKLDELRRQFRKRSQAEASGEMDAIIERKRVAALAAHKRAKILERCDCGHLAEEHSGPDARESLTRASKPALPHGYCYRCSCTRHKPAPSPDEMIGVGADWERWPLPPPSGGGAGEAEERRRFSDELMGRLESSDFRSEPIPFATLVDATRADSDVEGAAKKLLGSYAFWVPPSTEHAPSEGDLVQLKGWFTAAVTSELFFSVWSGLRGVTGNPITTDVPAKNLYVVEHVACPYERGDRSGSHATFRRGLNCKMCGNLGRVISLKSAVLLPKSKTP